MVTDILDHSLFDVYRAETDREMLIYNGDLQLSYLIPDVRIGDTLDYAYSIIGKNPATAPHFSGRFQFRYGIPVQRMYQRILFPKTTAINVESFGETIPPKIAQIGEMTEYVWDRADVPAFDAEADISPSQLTYPMTQFSTFENWNMVGEYFTPYFAVTKSNAGPIHKIAADIRAQHDTQKAQTRAALDFVQREIRYLGIELGPGGYIPRQPEEVLRNRFGDCKDMTLLLIAILNNLEIEAAPFLVNLDVKDAVDVSVPTYAAFDHVIVSTVVDGKTYYLDPTRGQQLGDLEHLQQGNFGKGVVIGDNSPGMIKAPVPIAQYYRDITDTYDLVGDESSVELTSVSIYRMGLADEMFGWYNRVGAEAAGKSFLQYFQNSFPQIEQVAPLQLDVDEKKGEITLTAKFRIPDAWDEGEVPGTREFYTQADDVLQDMPAFVGTTRETPYQLRHPVRARQSLRFLVDNTWFFENGNQIIERPAFRYTNTELFANNIYTKMVTYQSKSNEILAKDFRDTMDAIQDARYNVGVTLSINDNVAENPILNWVAGIENFENIFVFGFVAISLFCALVGRAVVIRDVDLLPRQVYSPISVTKFTILSIASFGLYPAFWSYQNWHWLKTVESEEVSPFWRAFFASLMNFSLFPRMAARTGGYAWFSGACGFLAVFILLGAMSLRYFDRAPEAPDWFFHFGMASMIAWIPVVMHVNKMNEHVPECKIHNSKFGWPAIGLFVLLAPFTGLIVLAFFE